MNVCLEWKAQQKILWAEVREGSGRGKSRFMIREFLANGRCCQTALDFLSAAGVGGGEGGVGFGSGCGRRTEQNIGVASWELRRRNGKEGEQRQEAEELGAGLEGPQFLLAPSFTDSAGEE